MANIELGPGHVFNQTDYVDELTKTLHFHRNHGNLAAYADYVESDQRQLKLVDWIDPFTKVPNELDATVGPMITYMKTSDAYRKGYRLAVQGVRMTASSDIVETMDLRRIGTSYPQFRQAIVEARSLTRSPATIWSTPVRKLGANAYTHAPQSAKNLMNDWSDYLLHGMDQSEYFRMAFSVGMMTVERAVEYQVTKEFASFMRHAGMTEIASPHTRSEGSE